MDNLLTLVQTVVMILGFLFVVLKFQKYTDEISKSHDWNRRHASREACNEFMYSRTQDAWKAVRKEVVEERMTTTEMNEDQQSAFLEIIYYFENLGISIKNNIVDEDIIWDYFGALWPYCYESARPMVEHCQKIAHDDMVFEHFVRYAEAFEVRNKQIDAKKRAAGSLPGKSIITG